MPETTAKLLAVSEVSPTTELTEQMTRTNPGDGDNWEGIEDTIAFPDDKNYMKINNTEKLYYDHITYLENDISFRAIKRGVLEDFLVGNYCGDGIDPRDEIPLLQAKMGKEKPIHNVINYQAAIETGLSEYDWYDWLYDRGMYLQLAFEPKNPAKAYDGQPEWALDTYVGGSHDTDFERWAASIISFCETDGDIIYIRPMSEMNGDWTVWGDGVYAGNTPANYRAAWQYLWQVFEDAGANQYLKWIWCPVAPLSVSEATSCWTDYYPGDAYVDIIGMNGYNFGEVDWSFWRSFDEVFLAGYEEFKGNTTKDLYICEIGCNALGGNKPAWIIDAFWKMRNEYPRFVACTWFNMKEPSDDTINYRWDENQQTINAYKEGIMFRRECSWSGTEDCIHRVKHAVGSLVVGMGTNPPDTDPIIEKVATLSLEGDILTNIPISGDLWMYFENMTYVESNVWVNIALPKPTLSQDIYDGDIMNQNLGNIFGNPASEATLKVTGLTNATPPTKNITKDTIKANNLSEITPQIGSIQGGSAAFGSATGERVQLLGDDQSGSLAAYNAINEKTVQVSADGVDFSADSISAGVIHATGTPEATYSMETLAEWYDQIAFGNNFKQHIAQQFQATETCQTVYVRLKINRHNFRPAHSVRVRLREDNSNYPTGAILAEQDIYVQNTFITYFNVPLSGAITSGTKYWVELDSSVYLSNDYPLYVWGEDGADDYGAGLCKGFNGVWNTLNNHDIGLQVYKLTSSPVIAASQDFRVDGTLFGPTRKIILPLFHGGANGSGIDSTIDYLRRNSTASIGGGGAHLTGGDYYWAPDDWAGQSFAFYFECTIASENGQDISCILRDTDNGTNLAVITTANTAFATYSSAQLTMPSLETTIRLGLRTDNASYWAYVASAYIVAYCGSTGM